ncbi:MAG: 4-hydroxythreonine-4-phosphate dehydrogenase PdxA [Deltaproteobacteria bacterium]|nr:4-hydroxythreonine-4-phosphate dehydrogenase PdxA [Deltaproteobacteria bacterium]
MNRIVVSMGDPSGVGSEIIVKSLPEITKKSIPVVVGDINVIEKTIELLSMGTSTNFVPYMKGKMGNVEFIDLGVIKDVRYGVISKEYGHAAYQYLLEGLKLVLSGEVHGIVTCPINKKSFELAGIKYAGHTELLARLSGVRDYVMMLANRKIKVSLVTTHVPLRDVPSLISTERVFKTIFITYRSLKELFGIKSPSLSVCGLNPHAGEEGLLGTEESFIKKAIQNAREVGIEVSGPYSPDSVFWDRRYDAYIAMYHDQGIIPVKTLDFRKTVNITLGLPFVRTSPGHGTAFNISGKGVADPTSFIEAYRLAETLTKNLLTKSSAED